MEDFYVTISTNNTESTNHLAAPKILDKKYKVGLVSLYMNISELYGNITVTIHLFYINNLFNSQKL